jgi:arsenate reductase (thioredoxin)
MKRILVLCTGNSTRSQMAHGYLQQFAGKRAKVLSAGVETHGLNPKTVQVMAEDGVDISSHTSNLVDEYSSLSFDYVITVCDNASERCPLWVGKTRRVHHAFQDPSKTTGTPDEIMDIFRMIRDEIKDFSREFVQNELS